jgi:hypothetical protein
MNYEQLTESDSPAYGGFWKQVGEMNKRINELKPIKLKTMTPDELFEKAHKAGMEAGERIIPTPMTVQSGGKSYFVGEGVCGFAWIKIRPARGKFVKWLKATDKGHAGYNGGYEIWVGAFGQSMTRKEAYADAFAKVLQDAGINAYAQSRMD